MALVLSTLQSRMAKLMDPNNPGFTSYPASKLLAAQAFADAYTGYATAGADVAGNPLAVYSNAGFASALNSLSPTGTTAQFIAGMAQAFAAFWATATFASTPMLIPLGGTGGTGIFSAAVTSKVTAVDTTALVAALTALFATTTNDGNARANSFASALHTATTASVTVLIAGVDTTPSNAGGPLPITNTGKVS